VTYVSSETESNSRTRLVKMGPEQPGTLAVVAGNVLVGTITRDGRTWVACQFACEANGRTERFTHTTTRAAAVAFTVTGSDAP
jgi:hypothetical protein